MTKLKPTDLLEAQFQAMLINYMYSNWFGVEIRNGLVLGDQILFPVAVQLDPKEGKLNDFTTGQWLSGLDFVMANQKFELFAWELKRQVAGRPGFLEWLCQAYRGAFYLDLMDKAVLPIAFRDTVQILYALQDHSSLLTHKKNTLFQVHKAFYGLDHPLSLSEIDCRCVGIILSLNPGARFSPQAHEDARLDVGQLYQALKAIAPNSEKLGWLEPIPESYRLPVYLLEFDMSLSTRLVSERGTAKPEISPESLLRMKSAPGLYKRPTLTQKAHRPPRRYKPRRLTEETYWVQLREKAGESCDVARMLVDEYRSKPGIEMDPRKSSLVAKYEMHGTGQLVSLFFINTQGHLGVWPEVIARQISNAGFDPTLAAAYGEQARDIMHMPKSRKDYYCPIQSVDIRRFSHAVDEFLRVLESAVPEG